MWARAGQDSPQQRPVCMTVEGRRLSLGYGEAEWLANVSSHARDHPN